MPLSKVALVRSALLFIVVALVALISIVGVTLWLVDRTQVYSDTVLLTRQQRSGLADLRGLLQDAETGQRGYLLTGEDAYLQPYEDARGKVSAQLDRVRQLFRDEQSQVGAADRLSAIVNDKLSELNETVLVAKAGRSAEATDMVKTDRGRELMDEVRRLIGAMLTETEGRLATGIREQQESIFILRWVTILGALVILGVAGALAWMVVVYTRQLLQAQNDIQILNAGLEERVRERTADLARANDEIQRFAYIVTHDLRAPLVNIMGFTSELETSLAPIRSFMDSADKQPGLTTIPDDARLAVTEELPEAISFIRSSTRKMDGLINAILKLSREGRRTLNPERIDLGAFLKAVADAVRHQVVDAGGEVVIEGAVTPISSDRLALEQIFGNLLDNAVKYRAVERPLSIRVRTDPAPGNRVAVKIEDNGRGIAPSDHDRVFDLFRRSGAQDQPGEGLGLAHVRSMVRNLGGEISLASELGRGTTFTVTLPRDLRKAAGVRVK